MDKEQKGEVESSAVKKQKLNYRFHNPNPAAETADYILKILLEANTKKVNFAVQEAANGLNDTEKDLCEEHSA